MVMSLEGNLHKALSVLRIPQKMTSDHNHDLNYNNIEIDATLKLKSVTMFIKECMGKLKAKNTMFTVTNDAKNA